MSSQSQIARIAASTLRKRMNAGELVSLGWLQSGDWKAARALAEHHDAVVIDMEHGAFDVENVALAVEVLGGNGSEAIVRLPFDADNRKAISRRILDAGAIGILFPNVQTRKEAEELVLNCYYPAKSGISGTRGFGFGGCNADGSAFAQYAEIANSKIVVGVQLENYRAFKSDVLEDILKTPGLVFTQDGPYDHSGSYEIPGETTDARVVEDLRRYREACKKHGIVAGKHVVWPTEENIRAAITDGYTYIALGTDLQHIRLGAKQAMQIVASAGKK